MSASPKLKRTPPSNKFEDYILTYTVGETLYPIKSDSMSYAPGSLGLPFVIASGVTEIGFDFKFDNKVYRNVYISSYGFAILLDPEGDPETVIDDTMDAANKNWSVIASTWVAAHVIIAPWWDAGIKSIWRNVTDTGASTYIANQGLIETDLIFGISPMPAAIDSQMGGIKTFRGFHERNGRFFLIRWKVASDSSSNSFNVLTYDLVLYESGIVEIRYAPRIFLTRESSEKASMAIFANGGSSYGNRYRDLSEYIKKSSRGKYKNGGSVYDELYTDTNGTYSAPYTISLNVAHDWPGLERGATFSLIPPRNKRKQTRKVLNDRDASSFIKTGMFNDQKTINFVNQHVQYPSMLPVDYVTSMNDIDSINIVELCSSGSIEVNMNLKSGMFNDVMRDSVAERGKK